MLYKETILVFFLSYLFVLGNCQPSVACPAKNSQQPVACAAPAERQQIICQNEHAEKINHDKSTITANSAAACAAMTPTSLSVTPTPVVCDKLVKYDDNTGIIPDRYILMLRNNISQTDMDNLITLLKSYMNCGSHNCIRVKEVVPLENMKLIIVDINQKGLNWICQNEHIEKIEYDKCVIPTPTPLVVTCCDTPTPVVCDKLVKYDDNTGIIPDRYILMLRNNISQTDMDNLTTLLKSYMNCGSHNCIRVKEVVPLENMKLIIVDINQKGLNWICQNEHVEKIEYDKCVIPTPTPLVVTCCDTPTPVGCDKLVKYDDNTGIIPDRYILMLRNNISQTDMDNLITLLKSYMNCGSHNCIRVKVVVPLENMKLIIVDINQKGLNWICQNEHVEKIDYDKCVIPTPTPLVVTCCDTPTPVVCDKLVKYDDNTGIIPDRYILMLRNNISQTDMDNLTTLLKSYMNCGSHNCIRVKEVVPLENMKLIIVDINQKGLNWICQNEHVEKIDYDKCVIPAPTPLVVTCDTPTPVGCDKLVKYDDNTGIIPDRYILMLKEHTSQADRDNLITLLKSLMNCGSHNCIQVKKVVPNECMKLITVEINQIGLKWICQNEHVEKIDHDKRVRITSPSVTMPSVTATPCCCQQTG